MGMGDPRPAWADAPYRRQGMQRSRHAGDINNPQEGGRGISLESGSASSDRGDGYGYVDEEGSEEGSEDGSQSQGAEGLDAGRCREEVSTGCKCAFERPVRARRATVSCQPGHVGQGGGLDYWCAHAKRMGSGASPAGRNVGDPSPPRHHCLCWIPPHR